MGWLGTSVGHSRPRAWEEGWVLLACHAPGPHMGTPLTAIACMATLKAQVVHGPERPCHSLLCSKENPPVWGQPVTQQMPGLRLLATVHKPSLCRCQSISAPHSTLHIPAPD
jgi:hypothetical protein